MQRKLARSSRDRIISGVCGGLGEYFSIDPVIVRIGWAFLSAVKIIPGILTYIICAIIIPEDYEITDDDYSENISTRNTPLFIGIILIVIGGIMLVDIIFPRFFSVFRLIKYWPILLILAGIYIIAKQKSN
ncbi:MAG TPA: PspC domain-containing protein [Tissierellia bacterium]|nr:PspC domain-containing protein [Tissierellia bacterium]